MADDHGGTYVLHIDLTTPATIEFGAAGTVDLDSGRYAYVGSAFGPGGPLPSRPSSGTRDR